MPSPTRGKGRKFTKSNSMSYELYFLDEALKEWRKLDPQTQAQFKKKLAERLQNPHVPAARLSGRVSRYKIKLRSSGYRLVYEVQDAQVRVIVIAVGRRDNSAVYKAARQRKPD
jgi:mRNA interferase RelE/StbE